MSQQDPKRPRTDEPNQNTLEKSRLPDDEKCLLLFDLIKERCACQHGSIIQHFIHGKTKYRPIDILESWYRHPYGAKFEHKGMFSLKQDYKKVQHVRPAISSFAAQIVAEHLVQGAKKAIQTSNGLHVNVSKKKGRVQEAALTWHDISDQPIEHAQEVFQHHEPLLFDLVVMLATPIQASHKQLEDLDDRQCPELVRSLLQ